MKTIQTLPMAANDTTALVPSVTDGLVHMIERVARDPSVDLARLEKLMEMHERVTARNAEQAFHDAMSAAQKQMRPVAADANNPQTKSMYASYAQLDRAIRQIYTEHGFVLSFNTSPDAPEDYVRVICDVSRSGHTRRYSIDMPADGKGPKGGDVMTKTHATGSAVTYGMRYLLKMIFNIAVGEADDDGNAAADVNIEFISQKKWEELTKLADEIGMKDEELCKHCGVDDLSRLSAKNGDIVIRKLQKTKQMRAAKR